MEPGESESDTIVRELQEELGITQSYPLRSLWRSKTHRNVQLAWWHVNVPPQPFVPDAKEVESFAWLTAEEILAAKELLASNREFFAAWEKGAFHIE